MKPRGRPRKLRLVKNEPQIRQFSPRGKPGRPNEIELKIEEYETLRLTDYQGKKQTEAAKDMMISQQTFSRVLNKARKSLSEALVTGKIIRIQGGDYSLEYSPSSRKKSQKTRHKTLKENSETLSESY
ncbi:MAG: DUF134 domain-containing protein [Patescibacteria group bacterium]